MQQYFYTRLPNSFMQCSRICKSYMPCSRQGSRTRSECMAKGMENWSYLIKLLHYRFQYKLLKINTTHVYLIILPEYEVSFIFLLMLFISWLWYYDPDYVMLSMEKVLLKDMILLFCKVRDSTYWNKLESILLFYLPSEISFPHLKQVLSAFQCSDVLLLSPKCLFGYFCCCWSCVVYLARISLK